MKILGLVISIAFLALTSCDNIVEIDHPIVDPSGFLDQTTPLPDYSKSLMSGIYSVVNGSEQFGEQVVLKWSGNKLIYIFI